MLIYNHIYHTHTHTNIKLWGNIRQTQIKRHSTKCLPSTYIDVLKVKETLKSHSRLRDARKTWQLGVASQCTREFSVVFLQISCKLNFFPQEKMAKWQEETATAWLGNLTVKLVSQVQKGHFNKVSLLSECQRTAVFYTPGPLLDRSLYSLLKYCCARELKLLPNAQLYVKPGKFKPVRRAFSKLFVLMTSYAQCTWSPTAASCAAAASRLMKALSASRLYALPFNLRELTDPPAQCVGSRNKPNLKPHEKIFSNLIYLHSLSFRR